MTRYLLIAAATLGLIAGLSSAQTTAEDSDAGATTNLPPPASMDSPPSPGPAAPPSDSPVIAPGPYQALDGAGANGAGAGPWISSDYLLGYFQPARLPALVTTSPAGTPRARAGVLGLPTTSTLFDGGVNSDVRSGFRISGGYWFNDERTWGLEVSFMMFESQATFFSESSTETAILARPFTNAVTGLPNSVVVAFPGSGSGAIAARDNSGNFYETHIDLSERICGCGWFRVDGLLGYRFFRYDEGLRIQQTTSPTGAAFVPGTRISATDSFVAENEFNGFDLGFRTEIRGSNWTLDFLTKVATGGIFRQVKIDGNTTTTVPGAAPVTRSGGVLALSSNIGNHRSEDWTIFPEFGANLSWHITPRLEMRLGYSFLFMNDIVRAHDQLNFNINPGLFPPATAAAGSPNQPSFRFHIGDAWIQAINVGVQYDF
ncbi:MAG TPA: BBP7 family outer membrane beta-barrel protein [Gemmataceae bacterium]|nr:BBP7 family outer membrane beta-barrel protein [Gemmataceae bacterium]